MSLQAPDQFCATCEAVVTPRIDPCSIRSCAYLVCPLCLGAIKLVALSMLQHKPDEPPIDGGSLGEDDL
jgi:hypothetical protein